MILFSPFFSFSVKCRQPLRPAVVEVVVAPAAVAVAGGGAVVVVVVWKVSLDGLERWGKPFTLNPVGHEERVLDHDPALSAGQSCKNVTVNVEKMNSKSCYLNLSLTKD
jgi:hypothetical protein